MWFHLCQILKISANISISKWNDNNFYHLYCKKILLLQFLNQISNK